MGLQIAEDFDESDVAGSIAGECQSKGGPSANDGSLRDNTKRMIAGVSQHLFDGGQWWKFTPRPHGVGEAQDRDNESAGGELGVPADKLQGE